MNLLQRFQFNLRYFGSPPWDTGITPPEVFEFVKSHPAGRVLDIGCGTGTNIITLAKTGWRVTGFDFASRAIRIAKRKIKKAGVQADLFTDDVARMKNITGQYDLALDIGCFHGLENKAGYLAQLDRILVPGGFWLIYGFLTQDPGHTIRQIDPAALGMISGRGFNLLSQSNGFDQRERPSAWFLYQKDSKSHSKPSP